MRINRRGGTPRRFCQTSRAPERTEIPVSVFAYLTTGGDLQSHRTENALQLFDSTRIAIRKPAPTFRNAL